MLFYFYSLCARVYVIPFTGGDLSQYIKNRKSDLKYNGYFSEAEVVRQLQLVDALAFSLAGVAAVVVILAFISSPLCFFFSSLFYFHYNLCLNASLSHRKR